MDVLVQGSNGPIQHLDVCFGLIQVVSHGLKLCFQLFDKVLLFCLKIGGNLCFVCTPVFLVLILDIFVMQDMNHVVDHAVNYFGGTVVSCFSATRWTCLRWFLHGLLLLSHCQK